MPKEKNTLNILISVPVEEVFPLKNVSNLDTYVEDIFILLDRDSNTRTHVDKPIEKNISIIMLSVPVEEKLLLENM